MMVHAFNPSTLGSVVGKSLLSLRPGPVWSTGTTQRDPVSKQSVYYYSS